MCRATRGDKGHRVTISAFVYAYVVGHLISTHVNTPNTITDLPVLSRIQKTATHHMSIISTCSLLNKNLIRPIICFSLITSRSHFDPPYFASNCLRPRPIEARVFHSSSVLSSARSPFLGFRPMASQSTPPQSVHEFTAKDAKGNEVDLSTYKGKVLIIVNVASQCGLTNSNYTELTKLYEKYKDQGLEILAFPCNQFGSQEPGNNEQIQEFACTRFKAEYPIFDKIDVNGSNAAPLYKYLKSAKGGLLGDGIKWNFAKFLVDQEGHVVDRYAPTTSPLSIEKDIKKLLEKGAKI